MPKETLSRGAEELAFLGEHAVDGSDTVPMFPRNSNVLNVFSGKALNALASAHLPAFT
ncbi:MAG: hypothetical protein U0792_07175 [Gemmataceae bacterium]